MKTYNATTKRNGRRTYVRVYADNQATANQMIQRKLNTNQYTIL